MDNDKNEKSNELLKETIKDLEASLEKLKLKGGRAIVSGEEKCEKIKVEIKDKLNLLKKKAKLVKTKYQEADPAKQKIIIAGISAVAAVLLTAVIKSLSCKKPKE